MEQKLKNKIEKEGNIHFFQYKGLNCFVIRPMKLRSDADKSNIFHLCGYVGIPKGWKGFGKYSEHKVFKDISVHGGLTFPTDPIGFARAIKRISKPIKLKDKATREFNKSIKKLIPLGNKIARREAKKKFYGLFECKNPWFVGFDCAHAGDLSYDFEDLTGVKSQLSKYDTYKDLEYVKKETINLTKQIIKLQEV